MTRAAMEGDKDRPIVRRPDVLRKFNAESLLVIERGLLGDLPEKLKPQPFVSRARPNNLQVAKHSGLLSSCLPVTETPTPTSPGVLSEDDISPLKKSFSFRDKFSRMGFFGKDKDKEKTKWKTIDEGDDNPDAVVPHINKLTSDLKRSSKAEYDYKNLKRFWFFRQKDIDKQKQHTPIYQRSKSFEFLPRAVEEYGMEKKKRQSSIFETESMGEAWTSNESLEYISNVYYDKEDGIFLKSIREFPSESSSMTNNNSSISTGTSASSMNADNIFKTASVQNLLDEFNKAVDLFSESYLSDSEPYTKTEKQIPLAEKRKSSSFSNIPSPKVLQVPKVSEISEDFKKELSKALIVKRSLPGKPRRGSVTDWFVLEDQVSEKVTDVNKFRRGQKKPMNRVRRISSTKYWITPEECAVYSREQRPPLVIPRITQYRAPRPRQPTQQYQEDTVSSMRSYDRFGNWSPTSEKTRVELERSYSKVSDSPPFSRINKRLGGSTENLLLPRRPQHLQLPASSSGDSLDVEMRGEHQPVHARSRKVRSMVHRRSPVPAHRTRVPPPNEASAIMTGPVKRTKFFEGGKKSKKNWTEGFMILTSTALYFYKDQKSYNKSERPPGTPPSPTAPQAELVLPLRNAKISQCQPMHTRRHTRSLVLTWDRDQYLIQDETDEGARKWFHAIQNAIARLYPIIPMDNNSQHYQSSNTDLESLGRTPPASRHANRNKRAGGSSNEDLSDSTEVSKSHVRSRLRKFFAKRPAMEVLVKKGIYKDEPVFGRNLEEVCPTTSPRVPEFVVACVTEIEKDIENLCTDGLYRASGNLSQVQKIRLEIDQNNMNVIENNTDIHVLTGSLKLFFRELKEPLIPCSFFDKILAACSIKPKEAKIKEFRDIIQALPQCNRDTLKYLLEHLLRVTKYSERNRMHTANLAIVFGPTLLWAPAEQAHNIAVDCIQQNNVVDILLNEFKDIFVEDTSKGKKKA